jgi:hypothetical protein
LPPILKPRAISRVLLLLLALAPAGCGLADYEKKMQETDARIKRFEEAKKRFGEENKLLGDPVEPPTGDAAPPAPVFLRPPKSIVSKAAGEKGDLPYQYHYPAAAGTTPACTDLYLIFKTKDDDIKALKTELEVWLHVTGDWKPYTTQPPNGREPVAFEAAQLGAFWVYVHKAANGPPIAVLYRIAQPPPAGADDAVKMSLETYADSDEAGKVRHDYDFWHAHAP